MTNTAHRPIQPPIKRYREGSSSSDARRLMRTHTFTAWLFALYLIGATTKFTLSTNRDSELFYPILLCVNIVELVIWLKISTHQFAKSTIRAGLTILYTMLWLYATVPLIMLAFDLDIFPFPATNIKSSMLGQSLALTHTYFFIHLLIKPTLITKANLKLNEWLNSSQPSTVGSFIASLCGLLIASAYFYNFHNSGVAELIGNESRIAIAKAAETGKTWLLQYAFFSWTMATVAVSFLGKNRMRTPIAVRAIQLLAISMFMYAYLSIGNRRELAILLIFLLLLSTHRNQRYLKALAVLSLPLLLFLGILRTLEGAAISDIEVTTNLLNLFGEFVFPHYSLIYYSSLSHFDLQFGQSFLLLPSYALPSFGLWEKANSLSIQFSSDYANLSMGYALTPLAEGYINFGWSAVFLTPILLTLTIFLALKLSCIAPPGLLVLLSFPLDISRGEFTTIAFQWIIFTLVFSLVAWAYRLHRGTLFS